MVAASLLGPLEAFGFAGMVSPPRFELQAKPGQVLHHVIEVGNDAVTADEFVVATSDWRLNEKGGVEFQTSLQPDSCRPWVRIERRSLIMAPKSLRKFRFEVHVPADAPARECRFAIVVEKADTGMPQINLGTIRMPLQGRIAVIAYIAVGDVAPKLELRALEKADINGRPTPSATIHNSGTAHGRPEGLLEGTDSAGQTIEFVVSSLPILPGETRVVPFWAQEGADKKPVEVRYPLKLRGLIEWQGGKAQVDTEIR